MNQCGVRSFTFPGGTKSLRCDWAENLGCDVQSWRSYCCKGLHLDLFQLPFSWFLSESIAFAFYCCKYWLVEISPELSLVHWILVFLWKLTSSAMAAFFWRCRNPEVDNCILMYCFRLWSWVQHACRWTKSTCLGCQFLRIITLQSSLVIVLSWATGGQWLYRFFFVVAGESRNKCSCASWNPATPSEIPGLCSYTFNYLEYVHSCEVWWLKPSL